MAELGDDDKTIFSTDLDSEERAAVKSGEKRGEREAMAADPERFGMARARARNRAKYAVGFDRIKW